MRNSLVKVNHVRVAFMDIDGESNSRSDESEENEGNSGAWGRREVAKTETHACRHGLPRMRVSSLNSLFALIEIVQEKNT